MKTLPAALVTSLSSEEYIPTILIGMTLGPDSFNITPWNHTVVHDSVVYSPRAMTLNGIGYSAANIVDSVRMVIDDTDRSLYSVFGKLDTGDHTVNITLAILNVIGKVKVDETLVVFDGFLDQWIYEPGSIKITAVSIFSKWTQQTTNRFSGSCSWKVFKGTECQYSGTGTDCDRTYDTCKFLYNNEEHYGGFRFLPSMINRRIEL